MDSVEGRRSQRIIDLAREHASKSLSVGRRETSTPLPWDWEDARDEIPDLTEEEEGDYEAAYSQTIEAFWTEHDCWPGRDA